MRSQLHPSWFRSWGVGRVGVGGSSRARKGTQMARCPGVCAPRSCTTYTGWSRSCVAVGQYLVPGGGSWLCPPLKSSSPLIPFWLLWCCCI